MQSASGTRGARRMAGGKGLGLVGTGTPIVSARVAIYARFSDEKQSDASIEDQVHRAHDLLRQQGADPDAALVFTDHAKTASNWHRPGARALEDAVTRGDVDIIVAES